MVPVASVPSLYLTVTLAAAVPAFCTLNQVLKPLLFLFNNGSRTVVAPASRPTYEAPARKSGETTMLEIAAMLWLDETTIAPLKPACTLEIGK